MEAPGGSSRAGVVGLAEWGALSPHLDRSPACRTGREKYPCCCSLPSPPPRPRPCLLRLKEKKGKKKKTNKKKTSECKVPDQAQPGMGVGLCPAGLQRAIPKSAPSGGPPRRPHAAISCHPVYTGLSLCFLPRGVLRWEGRGPQPPSRVFWGVCTTETHQLCRTWWDRGRGQGPPETKAIQAARNREAET